MFENQYLTFQEYSEMGGTLIESAFNLLEYKARKKIDEETNGRLVDLETQIDDVKLCIYELIGVYNENNTTIKSESVDGYSITLLSDKDLKTSLKTIINTYLSNATLEDGTPYLYRGFDTTTLIEEI